MKTTKEYIEEIIDLLMINGGEIILKDNKKFRYQGKRDEYHLIKKIFLTDPDYPKIRVTLNKKIYNFVPYNIIEWENLYNHIANKENRKE